MRRSAAPSNDARGRQSLSHHSSAARTSSVSTCWATMLQMPHPANAITTAAKPLATDAAKVTFESSAKRNCRAKRAICTTPSALAGSSR